MSDWASTQTHSWQLHQHEKGIDFDWLSKKSFKIILGHNGTRGEKVFQRT